MLYIVVLRFLWKERGFIMTMECAITGKKPVKGNHYARRGKAKYLGGVGRKVTGIVRTDGLKLILDDGSWVCYRLSGTEPVVRAYTEARNEKDMQALRAAAEKFVLN